MGERQSQSESRPRSLHALAPRRVIQSPRWARCGIGYQASDRRGADEIPRLGAQKQRCRSLFRRLALPEHPRDPDLLRRELREIALAAATDVLAGRVQFTGRLVSPGTSASRSNASSARRRWPLAAILLRLRRRAAPKASLVRAGVAFESLLE